MRASMESSNVDRPAGLLSLQRSDLKIAVQSALAAALCMGLPTGLFFWLITVQKAYPSAQIDRLVAFFSRYLVPPDLLETAGAFLWGILLSKISGYRQWWWLSAATILGVRTGTFALYHGFLSDWFLLHFFPDASMHIRLGFILTLAVLSVTLSTSLLLGLTLRNGRASLIVATSTAFAAVLAALLMYLVLGEVGIHVGSGNAAMPKLTAAATMAAALAGGATLGVLFRYYVSKVS